MSVNAAKFMTQLLFASCFLAVTALAMRWLFSRLQLRSAFTHIAAWSLVLIQGIAFVNFTVEIPWYEVQQAASKSWAASVTERSIQPESHMAVSPEAANQPTLFPSFAACAFWAWLGVCGLLLFRWCWDYARFVVGEDSAECDCEEWNGEWESVKTESHIGARIPLHVSQDIGPLLCRMPSGYRVIVPYKLWKTVTDSQRRLMLRHELAHFERGDVWWSLLAHLAAIPHWFNPLAWYAVRRLEQGLEWACDDKTRAFGAQQQTEYAATLLAIGEFGSASIPRCVTAINGSQLGARINRLLPDSASPDKPSSRLLVFLAAVVFFAIHLLRVDLVAQQTTVQAGLPTESQAWLMALVMDGKRVFDPAVLSETEARDLALNGAQITDDELERLSDHTDLQRLGFYDTNVQGPGLKHLSTLKKLEQIVLAGPHVTDAWLENLPEHSGLRHVIISQTKVTDDGLMQLKKFPRLRVLDLRYSDLNDGALKVLAHLPNLASLYVGNTGVGDDSLAYLRFTPLLSRLDLKHTAVTDKGLVHLRHVPRLRYFSLASVAVRGHGIANLKHAKRLEKLQFVGRNVSDSWLRSLPPLGELYWFQLHDTSVTSAGLRPIRTWGKLENLHLDKNDSIDDEIANHLHGLNRLESLGLRGTGVTTNGVERLRKSLPLAKIRAGSWQP